MSLDAPTLFTLVVESNRYTTGNTKKTINYHSTLKKLFETIKSKMLVFRYVYNNERRLNETSFLKNLDLQSRLWFKTELNTLLNQNGKFHRSNYFSLFNCINIFRDYKTTKSKTID